MRQAITKRPTDAHLTTTQVRTVRRRTPLAVSSSLGTALCAFTLSAAAQNVTLYGTVDAGFRDPSGNGWKMIQLRGAA